jgi:hypothetical protein
MKVVCAYCASEGKPALMGEREPLDDPRVTHGICAAHQRRLARTAKKSSKQTPPCVREPAAPDIEGKPIGPPRRRDRGNPVATRAGARPLAPMPKPIVYLCRGEMTWLLSQDIADPEGSRPYFTATEFPRDMDGETALRMVQAEFPDYDIRVMNSLLTLSEESGRGIR